MAWMERAVCRDLDVDEPDLMYPEPDNFTSKAHFDVAVNRAKAACARCPVRTDCLTQALAIRDEHGIWGGLTWAERKRLLAAGAQTEVSA